jgi:DeoR family transcriptional regulator of aga operon
LKSRALRRSPSARAGSASPDGIQQPIAVVSSSERLLVEERRRRVLALVDKEERATVAQLVERFGVSAVTIRLDLDALSRAGALVRSHGGAVRRADGLADLPIGVKQVLHHAEKVKIGERAAEMVRPGEIVILDSGTTTVEVARRIRVLGIKPLTVITNALNVASELAALPQCRIIMLGGILRPTSLSLVGPHAEQTLKDLNADRLFMGVDGLDPAVGLTTPDVLEAQLNAMMIRVSREVIVVADSSKFNQRSLSLIAKVESVHTVVTDAHADPKTIQALRDRNVEVVIA